MLRVASRGLAEAPATGTQVEHSLFTSDGGDMGYLSWQAAYQSNDFYDWLDKKRASQNR